MAKTADSDSEIETPGGSSSNSGVNPRSQALIDTVERAAIPLAAAFAAAVGGMTMGAATATERPEAYSALIENAWYMDVNVGAAVIVVSYALIFAWAYHSLD